jgi:hypothetical protein
VVSLSSTREGSLTLQAAARGGETAKATIAAGIFRIRQQKHSTATTDLALVSAPGAQAACAKQASKGIVRTLDVTATKGVFRAVGGAASAVATSATGRWTTSDRCDGTLTTVRKGSVAVAAHGRKRLLRVTAGHSLLVRARLFAAKGATHPG